jgi:hypothetical protein
VLPLVCFGQISEGPGSNADKQLKERGEIYFNFRADHIECNNDLFNAISIDHIDPSGLVYAYANAQGFHHFRKQHPEINLLPPPSTLIQPAMRSVEEIKKISDWDFYPTYEAYVAMMYQFEDDYPNLCTIVSIGHSEEGRELLVARISDNATWDPGEAQFLYTSTMHGDETTGYVLMLRLIDYLLSNYGTHQLINSLVDNLDIWINPLANPDGTYYNGNNTVYGAKRFNSNNVDLNRNFADPDDGPHPDGQQYQAETEAFMAMAEANHFAMAANFHGGAEVFNYPWDTWSHLHADDDWWYFVGREWADTAQFYSPPGYFNDLNNGVTNGYAWYTTTGSRQDYMNYFHHCREVTLEISSTKLLPESMLNDFWEYNHRSFLRYMEQALFGIKGTITDEQTGQPVQASIFIEGHDMDHSWVASNKEDGWFYRPIFAGTYDLTVFVPGYEPKLITQMEVQNHQETIIDITLKATNSNITEYSPVNMFTIGPNPGAGDFILNYFGDHPIHVTLQIFNEQGRLVKNNAVQFSSSPQSYLLDLKDQSAGNYFLVVSDGTASKSFKIIVR